MASCNERICSGCLACENVCPYGAIGGEEKTVINLNGKREQRVVSVVNEALCQGCGAWNMPGTNWYVVVVAAVVFAGRAR